MPAALPQGLYSEVGVVGYPHLLGNAFRVLAVTAAAVSGSSQTSSFWFDWRELKLEREL